MGMLGRVDNFVVNNNSNGYLRHQRYVGRVRDMLCGGFRSNGFVIGCIYGWKQYHSDWDMLVVSIPIIEKVCFLGHDDLWMIFLGPHTEFAFCNLSLSRKVRNAVLF